jgi:antitoxin ParD1/3/4
MANVNLGPVFEEYVRTKVEGGQYNNVSEVVREALRLMMQQDRERDAKVAWLRDAIQEGLNSPVREWEGADEIIRLAREREESL